MAFSFSCLPAAYWSRKLAGRDLPSGRITKRAVDALKCPGGRDRDFLWDDGLAGFGVAAFPSGKKVYVAQFRKDGRSRRITIGEHGRVTPDEARSQAKVILGAVEKGADPIADRRVAREIRTFRDVTEEFMRLRVAAKRKPRTGETYDGLLRNHILPAIGRKRVVDVRRGDVARLHARLSDAPGAANRAVAVISAIWNWAARRDEVALAENPANGIERYPEQANERFLTSAELSVLATPCETARRLAYLGLLTKMG